MAQDTITLTLAKELMKLPKLYSTDGKENTKFGLKLVAPFHRFEWWLMEYDRATMTAFGYANLNDPQMSELGYIPILELLQMAICIDPDYKGDMTIKDVQKKMSFLM